jgi:DNA-binding transcriptional MerR regulator
MNKTMEEKKKAKEMKMYADKAPKDDTQKEKTPLTYEQLNNVCQQLFQQNQQLREKIAELGNVAMYKRLDYLFKAVELSSTFKDADFVNSCMDEIKDALTVKEEDNDTKE